MCSTVPDSGVLCCNKLLLKKCMNKGRLLNVLECEPEMQAEFCNCIFVEIVEKILIL